MAMLQTSEKLPKRPLMYVKYHHMGQSQTLSPSMKSPRPILS